MALSKEKMREYQRRRRAEEKEKVGGEPAEVEKSLGALTPMRKRWGEGVPVYIPPTEEEKAEYERRVRGVEVLNTTDRTFEEANPLYYKYEPKEHEGICNLPTCSKRFKTRLKLNKFCCRAHQSEFISSRQTIGVR